MSKEAQSIIVLFVGGALLRISLSDIYLRYVKLGLRPFLIAAGAVLVVTAAITLARDVFGFRRKTDVLQATTQSSVSCDADRLPDPVEADHSEDHGSKPHRPWSAWLLILPVLAIFLISPPPLGAYAVNRDNSAAVSRPDNLPRNYPMLPATDPVSMSISEYVTRAVWGNGEGLNARQVKLMGFIVKGPQGKVYLARLRISCCAADATPFKTVLIGDQVGDYDNDQWVEVLGVYSPESDTDTVDSTTDNNIPYLRVDRMSVISPPTEYYEAS